MHKGQLGEHAVQACAQCRRQDRDVFQQALDIFEERFLFGLARERASAAVPADVSGNVRRDDRLEPS
jgi:hypothetical protein